MYEDPFDRLCRMVAAMVVFIGCTLDLLLRKGEIRFTYWFELLRIRVRGYATQIYYRYIYTVLALVGIVKPPTWTEVEAYRLRVIALTGQELPRMPELEEGLREEQLQQERRHQLLSSQRQEPGTPANGSPE